MVRYRLDDLGWFHFEKLVQSLLKAYLGIAVQSWGGHGDLGRDAYICSRLPFPDPSAPTDGPFLFQVKFVQEANAAGANWRPQLIKSVASEKARIKQRKNSGVWVDPAHYVLLTNCPLTPRARNAVDAELKMDLPNSQITTLGGSDISDLLDMHPELRRSFPEILSLRDLDLLLSEAVNSTILERSRAAVEESRELIPVFVPTQAYHKAWHSLQKYSFVVLDGPPEMGKTAIARTIALAHLISNWQAIDCRDPADFFSAFTDGLQQIFVADDAFGRTEYDPALGRMWERDLPRVFTFLDSKHRLIWTTRKHILTRACREMDLTGKSSRFPDPGEVIVTADDLSTEEKARILYRHSRAARLTSEHCLIIRENAVEVVNNLHFTPERIRRFICDVLPELVDEQQQNMLTPDAFHHEVQEAIRNPTERMQKSFRKLSDSHKWILIAFLECDGRVQSDALRERFTAFQPKVSESLLSESLDDLLGTFLKLGYGHYKWEGIRIDWIHPSYRDLVIDELASNDEYLIVFLKQVSISGVKLALSLAGGSSGERQMPLVTTEESWSAIKRRCHYLAKDEDNVTISGLFDVLVNALKAEGIPNLSKTHIEVMLRSICEVAVERWNELGEPLSIVILKSFHCACEALTNPPPFPSIDLSWDTSTKDLRDKIRTDYLPDSSHWSELADLINKYYPSFAEKDEFRSTRNQIERELFSLANDVVDNGIQLDDPESNESEGSHLEQFADALSMLDRDGSQDHLISQIYGFANEYNENGPREDEPDYEPEGRSESFDIEGLFEDL